MAFSKTNALDFKLKTMEKQYPLIYLPDGRVVAVDMDQNGKAGWNWDLILLRTKHLSGDYPSHSMEWNVCRKIVASNPALEGVPLLPEVEEDISVEAVLKGQEVYTAWDKDDNSMTALGGFQRGYKQGHKAASAKKFTEENIIKAVEFGKKLYQDIESNIKLGSKRRIHLDTFMQSLSPKPIAVVLEMEIERLNTDNPGIGKYIHIPKIINSQVVVRRWIYE